MDQQADTELDQADDEILTHTVSDEALEAAAAGSARRADSWLIAAPGRCY
jgi:hypothetical protein